MTFTLTVDLPRWHDHLRRVVAAEPGLVPVVKGRGYGIGTGRLAGAAAALAAESVRRNAFRGVDTVATGTEQEALEVAAAFAGDVLVLAGSPDLRVPAAPDHLRHRVVRTVAAGTALRAAVDDVLAGRTVDPFVVEVDSSVHRQGVPAAEALAAVHDLRAAGAAGAGRSATFRGLAVHLPLRGGLREARRLAAALGAAAPGSTLWVSHLGAAGVAALTAAAPQVRVRERVGTRLWLGAPDALVVTGTVVDVRHVRPGTRVGYARRPARTGTVVVVTGGTVHGVGLQAEPPGTRRRLVAAGAGLAGLLGVHRSPFVLDGRRLAAADVPHMQVSLLTLPRGARVPAVGEDVRCRVRLTTAVFDRVVTVDGTGDVRPAAAGRPARDVA